jgi:hypothetical protein
MSDLTDFKTQLKKLREAVDAALPNVAEGLALTAKALAERRMKEQGFGVLYSSVKVPAWFLHGKELNQRGTKFLEERGVNPISGEQGEGKKKRRKKKGDPDPGHFDTTTNWGEFRQAQGLQAKFVDLSYSNMMWANMAPVKVVQEGEIIKALLGATNREAQNKMTWNFERYGDFIRRTLNEDDGKILGEYVINEISDVLAQLKQ